MFVKFNNSKGEPIWVNAAQVKLLYAKGKGTELALGTYLTLKVSAKPDDAAKAIAEAIARPGSIVAMDDLDDEEIAASS